MQSVEGFVAVVSFAHAEVEDTGQRDDAQAGEVGQPRLAGAGR
jgi:hypothetical protein